MEERMPAAATGSGRARACVFAVWLHGLGDCGGANEFIADHFSAAAFSDTRWAFPTAPTAPVTCNRGMQMPSWFDIHDAPITSKSVRDEEDVLRAVQIVHAMIDKEIAAGTNPEDVFVFGLSQGGALSIASVLLYPKTLGGCAVFSGFLPFNSSFAARVTDQAKKTPVLWIHGGADSLIPIQEGRDGVKFLRGLGMTCEFKAYDRLGHTLAPFELEYCERWASEDILKNLNEHREGQEPNQGRLSRSKADIAAAWAPGLMPPPAGPPLELYDPYGVAVGAGPAAAAAAASMHIMPSMSSLEALLSKLPSVVPAPQPQPPAAAGSVPGVAAPPPANKTEEPGDDDYAQCHGMDVAINGGAGAGEGTSTSAAAANAPMSSYFVNVGSSSNPSEGF